ncbi:hypothetical protein RYA05_03535 [Pseudomonas syringae pv. actinidiae]|nr:hypothetical protein [Pseudomonas syringae pv. actinidiae]
MRVIIVEKPFSAEMLLPIASKFWPGEPIALVAIHFAVFTHSFSFPSRTSYRKLPAVVEPEYNTEKWFLQYDGKASIRVYTGYDGVEIKRENFNNSESLRAFLLNATSVSFACDWDSTGALIFDQSIVSFLPEFAGTAMPAIKIMSPSDDHIHKALLNPISTDHPVFQAMLNAAKIKRYFEYNFHLNGNVILGDLYRHLSGRSGMVAISKYMLLMLFHIQQVGFIKEHLVYHVMEKWKGKDNSNGKTSPMGSPASRRSIVQNSLELGLLCIEEGLYRPTPLGTEFLNSLHKDCYDPYLPQRIEGWQALSYETAKPLMDTYLKTFFKKQKRFQASIIKKQVSA